MGIYIKIKESLASGKAVALVTIINNSGDQASAGRMLISHEEEYFFKDVNEDLADSVREQALKCLKKGQSTFLKVDSAWEKTVPVFIHTFNPPPRLIIMGGGHVGAALCRIASHLDYTIVLIDDRPSFASKARHPQAHRIICEKFDRALEELKTSPTDYIVIVTRGHQHDRLCLEKALESEAVYIGMIGSRRRVSAQLRSLIEAGYTEEQLCRVHSPIGLPIGAVTEAEIAISILAEITKIRRGLSRDEAAQKEIIDAISMLEENGEKAVLVTITNTQGSTPRKAGSQMIVYPDGSLKGTVGGGCSEAEVRREALLCLDYGKSNRFRLNLTADAAAEEGMACGGTMDINLELLPFITPEIFSK